MCDLFPTPGWEGKLVWQELVDDLAIGHDGAFAVWIEQIQEATRLESEKIQRRIQELEQQSSGQLQAYLRHGGDVLADMECDAHMTANIMHAAFVVGLWAKMDFRLKGLLRVCEEVVPATGEVRFDFGSRKRYLKTCLGIDVEDLKEYHMINAVQILNNSFKHDGGHYRPDPNKAHTCIESAIQRRWVIAAGEEVDYTKVPLKELLRACNAFYDDLVGEVKKALGRHRT